MKYCQNILQGREKSAQKPTDIVYIPTLLPGCSCGIPQGNSQEQVNTDITYKQMHDVYNLRGVFMQKAQWKLLLVLCFMGSLSGLCAYTVQKTQQLSVTTSIRMAAVSDIVDMNIIMCIFRLDFGVTMLISSLCWVIYLLLSCLHQWQQLVRDLVHAYTMEVEEAKYSEVKHCHTEDHFVVLKCCEWESQYRHSVGIVIDCHHHQDLSKNKRC